MKNIFKTFDKFFEIFAPALFFIYGIAAFIFSGLNYEDEALLVILEICLIISGLAKICDYIGGHKINHTFNFDIAFGIISIAIGIVALARQMELKYICLLWGIFEVVEGAFEIQHLIALVHQKEKIAIAEIVITSIQIVFGVLLCINTAEEIKLHLIIVGIVFVLSAIAQVLKTVNEHRRKD